MIELRCALGYMPIKHRLKSNMCDVKLLQEHIDKNNQFPVLKNFHLRYGLWFEYRTRNLSLRELINKCYSDITDSKHIIFINEVKDMQTRLFGKTIIPNNSDQFLEEFKFDKAKLCGNFQMFEWYNEFVLDENIILNSIEKIIDIGFEKNIRVDLSFGVWSYGYNKTLKEFITHRRDVLNNINKTLK